MQQRPAVVDSHLRHANMHGASGNGELSMAVERLPFTIKRVQSEEEMRKAVRVRHAAYSRHVPAFARTLAQPEDCDYDEDTIVLLAESKFDGSPLGSTRIRTNLSRPLGVEESIVLPEWLQGLRLAEATRLSVDEGRIGRLVKISLIKACFDYCKQNAIEWTVATGRAPVDRQYEQLLFVDVFADKAMVPLSHVGNIPHRVMAFEIDSFESRWTAAQHPLLKFFFHTRHPDIDMALKAGIFGGSPAGARRPQELADAFPYELAAA